MSFPSQTRKFITQIISRRKKLIEDGSSKKDIALMNEYISHLENLLSFWPYKTNHLMAGFVLREADKISSLIPSPAKKTQDEFQQIINNANLIKNGNRINSTIKNNQTRLSFRSYGGSFSIGIPS